MFVLTKEQFHQAVDKYRLMQAMKKELEQVQKSDAPNQKELERIFDSIKYDNWNSRRKRMARN